MADPKRKKEQGTERDQSSAHPKDWPGIPGRSLEHEASPDGQAPARGDAEVTEAQRELERDTER